MRRAMISLILYASATASTQRQNIVSVSKWTPASELASLRWDAITTLNQAINGLVFNETSHVAPLNATTWPMRALIDAAHGNGSRAHVPLHASSKDVAAQL